MKEEQRILLLLTIISISAGQGVDLQRCGSGSQCPDGAVCFRDECARCLCKEKHHVVNFYSGHGRLRQVCQPDRKPSPLVGEVCHRNNSLERCPSGSFCNRHSVCECDRDLQAARDLSYCRKGLHREACSRNQPCEEALGLVCRGPPRRRRCRCARAFRRPGAWTRFVLTRWDYRLVAGTVQACVARAVGEPCDTDEHCAAVAGSGAVCAACGLCQCRRKDHVPDVLGTRCGAGLGLGGVCTLNSALVCDGAAGLQCGDVCDIYAYNLSPKRCGCSQMHDREGDVCVPKKVGSACDTDLDCYAIADGFGYCDDNRCHAHAPADGFRRPHLATHTCKGRTGKSPWQPTTHNAKDDVVIAISKENSLEEVIGQQPTAATAATVYTTLLLPVSVFAQRLAIKLALT